MFSAANHGQFVQDCLAKWSHECDGILSVRVGVRNKDRFDILIDSEFKPWLLEVNHTPSFSTDTPLDRKIKKAIVSDTIRLLNLSSQDKVK